MTGRTTTGSISDTLRELVLQDDFAGFETILGQAAAIPQSHLDDLLWTSVSHQRAKFIDVLLARGANVSYSPPGLTTGQTMVHLAATFRGATILLSLLRRKPVVNVNAPDSSGLTPLHYAGK